MWRIVPDMKHTSPEFYDDIYLAELINSAHTKEHGWLFYFLATLAVGVPCLGLFFWWVR